MPAKSRQTRSETPKTQQFQQVTIVAVIAASTLFFSAASLSGFTVPKSTIVFIGAALLLAARAFDVARSGRFVVPTAKLALLIVPFVVGLVGALIVADVAALALLGAYGRQTGVLSYAAFVVFFYAVVAVFSWEWLRTLTIAVVAVAGLAALYGLLAAAGIASSVTVTELGLSTTLGNPNFASGWLALAAAPLAYLMVVSQSWAARGGLAAVAIVIVWAMVLTRSNQGFLAAAAALLIFAVISVRAYRPARARAVLVLGAAVAGLGAAVTAVGLAGSGPLSALGTERSFQLRRWYWQAAVDMFTANPLLGVGMDHYALRYRIHRPVEAALDLSLDAGNDAAHSVVLSMFANGGLVLGVGYLIFVLGTAYFLVRGALTQTGDRLVLLGAVGAAWAAYQLQSLVSIDAPPLALMHFVLAGAVVAASGIPVVSTRAAPWATAARRRRQRDVAGWVTAAVIALPLVWLALIPLRADMAADEGAEMLEAELFAPAAQQLSRAVDIAPWEEEYRSRLAIALVRTGNTQGALEVLDLAIDHTPGALEPMITGARLAMELGDIDTAVAEYDEALRWEPHHPELKLEFAKLLVEQDRDLQRATQLLEAVVALQPDNAEAQELLERARGSA